MIEISEQKALGSMIQRHIVEPLINGRFHTSEIILIQMAMMLCHIEKNIAETCRMCNDCDPKTLKRWEDDPNVKFPKHHKDSGGKHYYYLDEVERWKNEHQDILQRVIRKKKL